MTRVPLWLLVVALAGVGCSLALPFDEDAQPCDPAIDDEALKCRPNFECIRDVTDAGTCQRTSRDDG